MQVETIRSIHGYNSWATERVLECAAALSREEFVQADDTPWGSIRNQLVHLLIVHKRWLSWADGSLPGDEAYRLTADPNDYPDFDSVRTMWDEVRAQNEAFIARMTDEDLTRDLTVEWPNFQFSMPVWKVMVHIANHSMQHRTELTMSLTRLGHSPGDVDYIFYAMEENTAV